MWPGFGVILSLSSVSNINPELRSAVAKEQTGALSPWSYQLGVLMSLHIYCRRKLVEYQ